MKSLVKIYANACICIYFKRAGWGEARDKEIASCKLLLNIHHNNDYNIFDSIRCDRWIFAGMPVISETSEHCEYLDIYKNNLVIFFPYNKLVDGVINFPKNIKTFDYTEYINKIHDKINIIKMNRKNMLLNSKIILNNFK